MVFLRSTPVAILRRSATRNKQFESQKILTTKNLFSLVRTLLMQFWQSWSVACLYLIHHVQKITPYAVADLKLIKAWSVAMYRDAHG